MGEMAQAMKMLGKLGTAIMKYPSGRYGIVGSVPAQLTKMGGSPLYPMPVSMVWNTEQEVIDALVGIGITHFQKADCSFYDAA